MVVIVAEGVLDHPGALDKKTDLVLVSHADATVHLDSFIGGALGHFAQLGFGGTGDQGQFPLAIIDLVQGL